MSNKKIKIFLLTLVAVLFISMGSFMIYKYYYLSSDRYVRYTEDSDLDYKVYYKDNNFFETKYVEKNNKYIANLIKYINAKFDYDITFLENSINYDYTYKIIANLSVLDSEDKEKLYTHDDVLFESNTLKGTSMTSISKSVDIDYNKYNSLISKFVNTYDLKDVDSNLKVSMYIDMKSTGNKTIEDLNKKSVISLNIPLTKKTIGISLSSDLTKSNNRKLLIKNNTDYTYVLIIGIAELLVALIIIVFSVYYVKNTRSVKSIYAREIRKILNSYSGYIQKINSKYKIGTSQVIKVDAFSDMLEIRDTLKTPILMLENERKDGTFFIIPAANGIIYAYALRVVDIIARKKGEVAPEYDLKNIDKAMPKKYTAEFIDEQIEKTRSMKTIDISSTIKGNKDKDENIYDQLEKTISIKKIEKPKETKTKKTTTKKKTAKEEKNKNEIKSSAKKTVKTETTKKTSKTKK